MDTNKILVAGLVGGIVAFILGFLIYGLAMASFFESNAGSASGVMRGDGEMMWIPMIIGHLSLGLLFAYIFGKWANISTFTTGAQGGAVIGLLMGLGYNMINLGSTHIMNTTGAIVDVVITTIMSAIIGGVVALMLGRGGK
jgi:hypothetical protein